MQYVTPDVIVRKVRGRWTATLNEAVVPRVRLNRSYAELFQRHRMRSTPSSARICRKRDGRCATWSSAFRTILSVAQAILKRQQHFLAYGPMAMKPLALREIAQEVGVHESTVSRVTNNKFMATPCGVFELKYFFSRGLATASGGECSPTAIRGLIQEMIAAEPPGQPLSDGEIARQLDSQGLKVARRTVTKYRQLLQIEPAERRRRHCSPSAEEATPTQPRRDAVAAAPGAAAHPGTQAKSAVFSALDSGHEAGRSTGDRHARRGRMGRGRTGAQPDAHGAQYPAGRAPADPRLRRRAVGRRLRQLHCCCGRWPRWQSPARALRCIRKYVREVMSQGAPPSTWLFSSATVCCGPSAPWSGACRRCCTSTAPRWPTSSSAG